MGWKIQKLETGTLTREIAMKYREMPPVPNDRPLSESRLAFLGDMFKAGHLRRAEFASVFVKQANATYRVDGKHTSELFASMNGEFPKGFPCIQEIAVADTMEDAAQLYSTYNAKESSRTQSDINAAFAGADDELRHVCRDTINFAVTSMSYAMWEGSYSTHDSRERARLSIDNKPFVRWLARMTEGSKEYRFMRRGSVGAAMYRTFNKSQKAATEFWTEVRDATNPEPKNASRVLAKYLLTTMISSQRATGTGIKTDTLHGMYVRCIHAWNAWRAGESTTLKYFPDKPTPGVR